MEQGPTPSATELIGDLVDAAADLTARVLSDRTGLGVSAAFAMHRLSREGPLRLTALATREGVSQPSMSQLMQRLERAELIARIPDPDDGRACLVGITEQGRALIDARRNLRLGRLSTLLEALSEQERDALLLAAHVAVPILAKLAANADEPATAHEAVPD